MNFDNTLINPCGDGWCVKTSTGVEGPLDSIDDANDYATLLTVVQAARCQHNINEQDHDAG